MLTLKPETTTLLGVDPGVTNGLSVVCIHLPTLLVGILELRQCSQTQLVRTMQDLIEEYEPDGILYEDFIHFTKARDDNTTLTIQCVGKVKAVAEIYKVPCASIAPGKYRFAEKRWPNELRKYNSHSGAALKQLLTHLYHDQNLHKLVIRDGRSPDPHNGPEQVPTVPA